MADIEGICYSYDTAEELHTALVSARTDFNELKQSLATLADSVESSWKGNAKSEFLKAYKSIDKKLVTVDAFIDSLAKAIDIQSEEQKETEKKSSSKLFGVSF